MKVGIVYSAHVCPNSKMCAADRRVYDLFKGLSFCGAEVQLFTPSWNKRPDYYDSANIPNYRFLGIAFSKIPILNRIWFWIELALACRKSEMKGLIYYTPTIDAIICFTLLKWFRIKNILEIADLDSRKLPPSIRRSLFKMGERILPNLADLIVPISSEIGDSIIKTSTVDKPMLVLPIFVDTEQFVSNNKKACLVRESLGVDPEEILISYVGGMYEMFGVDVLVKSFSTLVSSEKTKVSLLIAGKTTAEKGLIDIKKCVEESEQKTGFI